MSLSDTLGDPHDVSTLLFLQANVGIEHTKVKLLHEREDVYLHLKVQVKKDCREGGREGGRGRKEGIKLCPMTFWIKLKKLFVCVCHLSLKKLVF